MEGIQLGEHPTPREVIMSNADTIENTAPIPPDKDGLGAYQIPSGGIESGMAVIYKGILKGAAGQEVAIKKMRLDWARETGAEARFANEKRILVCLNKERIEGIPTFHFDGRTNDVPYLVMNWVDGQPLDQYCKENKLSVRKCVDLVLAAAEIVARVHRLVVHGDIKPSNILMGSDGSVTLIDFGIAGTEADLQNVFQRFGPAFTEGFSAPEQATQPIRIANDVYSLGRTLHWMLTGSVLQEDRPSEPSEANSIARWILGPNKKRRREISRIDRVVVKATALNPTDRYQTVEELIRDLRRCRKKLDPAASLVAAFRSVPVLATLIAAFLLFVVWRMMSSAPTIRIDLIPPYDQYGGPETHENIGGLASGVPRTGYHVVIYAYTGAWHVQPQVGSEDTPIVNGKWVTWTHTGQSYVALLVKDGYQPINPMFRLPAVGSGVVALDQRDGIR
jgi:predicted Ser/Thr protein kinase